MLKEIMQTLDEGEVTSVAQLARTLGVSEGLVAQMIQDLERRGYLESLFGDCASGACATCAFSKSCGSAEVVKSWGLTEKGRRAVTGS